MALVVKNLPANAGDKRYRFDPWVRKISCRRAWQPTPVFLPGESHGQRSLEGYGPESHKESDTTEATQHACIHGYKQGLGVIWVWERCGQLSLWCWCPTSLKRRGPGVDPAHVCTTRGCLVMLCEVEDPPHVRDLLMLAKKSSQYFGIPIRKWWWQPKLATPSSLMNSQDTASLSSQDLPFLGYLYLCI